MLIFPAIDLFEKQAVRLFKGNYAEKTVYSSEPWKIGLDFAEKGATHIHIVDLEGARDGGTPNFDTVMRIKKESGLFCEIGGGIRDIETARKYISGGIDRVILGTAAVTSPEFLEQALKEFGEKIAVGADIKDGKVAIKGWLVSSDLTIDEFFADMQKKGVKTVICTDISKDGAMKGTNRDLYAGLSKKFDMNITASGGVSTLEDITSLREMGLYGAIIGKAYYEGAIDLEKAVEVAK